MNLIQIPFHDLRKIAAEGARTRDAHLIESFVASPEIDKLLVIDRPTTWLEIKLKKKPKNIKHQKVLLHKKGMKLLQISEKYFAVTYDSHDVLGQILQKKKWFRSKFATKAYINFIHESLKFLQMDNTHLVSNNIFACDIFTELHVKNKTFDAWDDFAKIGNYASIKDFVVDCYKTYAKYAPFWTTNAEKNKISFQQQYSISEIHVVTNGVDQNRFSADVSFPMPEDMQQIPKPIYGFGGKITHLINPVLMREVAEMNPEKSFVFVGQNMVPEILNEFSHLPNVYYLGDKHYDDYIHYLANFDICLVPYVDDKKSSGANTIKVYEYLAMGKKVVGTLGNGLEKLQDYVYVAQTAEAFSDFLKEEYANKSNGFDAHQHAWSKKAQQIIALLK